MTREMQADGRSTQTAWWALLAVAFAARLAFGLTSDFWGEDELQIFLIGLEYYTTGVWPLYGPDVVYTHTRVPGGLQGLLVGGPLWIVPRPEAPYVLLNLLSFAALAALAWYITRRLPDVPRWIVWSWILSSPWTLDVTTHIINTSYVAVGAVPFFIGVFELVPSLRRDIVPRRLAWIGLGFGTLWVAQFHLSAVLMVVIGAAATALALRRDGWPVTVRGLMWSAAGAVLAGATLVPTLASEGLGAFAQPGANVVFAPEHLTRLPQIAAQVLSFGSFEIARFIGSSTTDRLEFLARYWWAAPAVLLVAVAGVAQVVVLFLGFFRPSPGRVGWPAVRWTVVALIGLVYASFMFSVKSPASHAFYFTMPAVVIYAFSCWAPFLSQRRWQIVAAVILVAGAMTHIALAHRNFQNRSFYRDRARVVRAIEVRDYRIVGERRSELWQSEAPDTPAIAR